jgi:hypothetical protein
VGVDEPLELLFDLRGCADEQRRLFAFGEVDELRRGRIDDGAVELQVVVLVVVDPVQSDFAVGRA